MERNESPIINSPMITKFNLMQFAYYITGKIVLTGGLASRKNPQSQVFSKGISLTLPDLPEPVYGHTLTHLGDGVVLQLGGVGSTKALILDTSAENPQWGEVEGMGFFNNKSYFTSVKLGNQPSPWIVMDSKLHKIGPSGTIETIQLPFNVTTGHCAVANDHHMYVIGAGPNRDEIWVNAERDNPFSFKKVNKLREGLIYQECIWIGHDIFIYGGYPVTHVSSCPISYVYNLINDSIKNSMDSKFCRDHATIARRKAGATQSVGGILNSWALSRFNRECLLQGHIGRSVRICETVQGPYDSVFISQLGQISTGSELPSVPTFCWIPTPRIGGVVGRDYCGGHTLNNYLDSFAILYF